ncbi:MAG: hypothetical protein HY244_05080 [Rhizobiales bacterium]|nr:hypothetical protein [Hyphomicrobiales bacterium]
MRKVYSVAAVIFCAMVLMGCGLSVPEIEEWYQPREQQKITENRIINHIKCELHKGMDAALDKYLIPGKKSGYSAEWFKSWLATVTLKLSVDEKSSINPGVTWVRNWSNNRSFTLGAGVNASADATRVETISFTYPLKGLRMAGRILNDCEGSGEVLIEGDLKIGQFLDKKIFLTTVPGTIPGPYSAFSYQVTFVVVYGGAATPTWKLVDITANPNSPFFNTSRTRTHDIIITFSAPTDEAAKEATAMHNAALIGQAVAAAIRAGQ